MRRLLLFSAAAILAFTTTQALAVPTTDSFLITLYNNDIVAGGGTGYDNGSWYYYDNTGWWNQWFYDDPPDPTRWKEITYDIHIDPEYTIDFYEIDVTIALNWSTLAYPESGPDGPPPLPPLDPLDETDWIEREVIFYDGVDYSRNIMGMFIIPDYNPEWVSIDVMVYDPLGLGVTVEGVITHECIPAPGAIILGSFGVGLVNWLRRRRTI